ncbi:MAG: HAMP domain-containing sensor histidine kinase [Chloroflexota bacterium]
MATREKRIAPYVVYLTFISIIGLMPILWGLWQIPLYDPILNWVLLIVLSATSQVATASVSVSEDAGITYAVGPAVSMAIVPFFGAAAAAVGVVFVNLSLFLLKPLDEQTWKKSRSQLAFNIGMHSIAIFLAGTALLYVKSLVGTESFLAMALPWLVAGIVYEEINLWLLIGILRLQHGPELNVWQVWREDRWASVIEILVTGIGGGLLAFAVESFDSLGIIIFFLPILLSIFAFRAYVRNMKSHMDNLENIVAERTKELETLNREKDTFLAVLTHDMKSPLNTIGLTADLLNSNPEILPHKPNLMRLILRSQQTLVEMVNNILDLEKLQADGSIPLQKEPIDLGMVINTTIDVAQIQATNKQISLNYEHCSKPIFTQGDAKQLERVLLNLLSNSIKYSPEGSKIDVSLKSEKPSVAAIVIEDRGYGIPADELPHIFDRFRRVKKHEQLSTGTGLGLAISKAIVEAHNGEIRVVSEEGVGSRFSVELPIIDN